MTGQVRTHIQTFDNQPKVRQTQRRWNHLYRIKLGITRYKIVKPGISRVIPIWPSYPELSWVIHVSGFQMQLPPQRFCAETAFDTSTSRYWPQTACSLSSSLSRCQAWNQQQLPLEFETCSCVGWYWQCCPSRSMAGEALIQEHSPPGIWNPDTRITQYNSV